MKETFKAIPGYEGLYEVSNLGRVKSLPRLNKNRWGTYFSKELIIKQQLNKKGYKSVVISNIDGFKVYFLVHQLIAMAFLGHKPNGMKLVIDHIDNDKQNNRVDNLQIVTNQFNVKKHYERKDLQEM